MAISTDSFGSPGLGEGIGLQGTLKDYTPLIAKNRMAQQAMAAKAAQKKLDKELEQQAELSDTMKGFKPIGGLPAFHMERQRISAELWNKATELRKVGQPLKGNVEWEKAKMAAQDRFNQLKFVEDRYTPGITSVASKAVNFDEYELNEPLMAALNNPDESDYLRLSGGKLTYAGELLSPYAKVDIDTYAKKLSDRVKPKVSMLDNVLVQQYQGVNDKAAFIEDQIKKAYEPTEVENAINQFKNSSEMMNWLDREERRFAKTGVAFDRNAAMERQANMLRSSFQNEQRRVLKQLFESKSNSLSVGGSLRNAAVVVEGVFSKEIPLAQEVKEQHNIYLTRLRDDLLANKKVAEEIGLTINTPLSDLPNLIVDYNKRKPDAKLAYYSPEEMAKHLANSFKDDKNAKYVSAKDKKRNVVFVLKYKDKDINAIPQGMTKIGGEYKFIVDKQNKNGTFTRMTIPLDDNAGVLAGDWLNTVPKENAEQAWIDLYEGENIPKKEQGGMVEPKSVSQKYHNKSKNLTKFVYSDGSEEVFNGIL